MIKLGITFILSVSVLIMSSVSFAEKEPKPVFSITSDKIGNVFRFGEIPILKIETDIKQKGLLYVVQVTDFFGRSINFSANTIKNQVTGIGLPNKEKGIFYVTATLKSGQQTVAETKTSYAIITPVSDEIWKDDSVFATQSFLGQYFTPEQQNKSIRLYRESGIKCNREEISWAQLVSKKGDWRWGNYDLAITKSYVAGLNNFVILDYWGPGMFSSNSNPRAKDIKPEHITKFAEYCFQVVARYKPGGILAQKKGWKNYGVRVWEIWNEPSTYWFGTGEQYGKLYRAAYDAIKRADPEAIVMYANANYVFDNEAINASGLKKFDQVAIHIYCPPRTPEEGKVNSVINDQRQVFVDNKMGDVPVWLTEIGWPTHNKNFIETEKLQAEYLVRSLVMVLPRGLNKVSWFCFLSGTENEPQYGIVNPDFTPKAAYVAYNTLINRLHKKKFVGEIKKGTAIKCYVFASESGSVGIIWSPKEKGKIKLASPKTGLKVFDLMNNEIVSGTVREIVVSEISENPVYVVSLESGKVLSQILAGGEIEGINTLEINIGELDARPDGTGIIPVQLVNTGEKIIQGKVSIELSEKWVFNNNPVEFGPLNPGDNEEKKFEFNNFVLNSNNEYLVKVVGTTTDKKDTSRAERVVCAMIAKKGTPQIDGDLTDWTTTTISVPLKYRHQVVGITDWRETDLSANVYFMWDDNNLYFAAVVKDNFHSQPHTGELVWQGDNIQVAFDTLADKRPQRFDDDDYFYGFSLTDKGSEVWLWHAAEGHNTGIPKNVQLVCKRDDDNRITYYEVKIPKEDITPAELKSGTKIGCSLIINDNDGGGRRGWIELTPNTLGAGINPVGFRDLYLAE